MSLHILALETSSAWCGVALLRAIDGAPSHIEFREHHGVQDHSARLLPMAEEVLAASGIARSDVDAIAFGQGPGGFTGLRVACGVAQGLGFALNRPVVPVPSHAAVAIQAEVEVGAAIAVAMDARMEEIYFSAFRRTGPDALQALCGPLLIAGAGLEPWLRSSWTQDWEPGATMLRLAGDAADAYPDVFGGVSAQERVAILRPTASAVARLARAAFERGEALDPEHAQPLYVRDKVAFTTAERHAGAGGNPKVAAAPGSAA